MGRLIERVEALIAKTERKMKNAECANIRNEYEGEWYESRILLAKMKYDLDEAIRLSEEYVSILKKNV